MSYECPHICSRHANVLILLWFQHVMFMWQIIEWNARTLCKINAPSCLWWLQGMFLMPHAYPHDMRDITLFIFPTCHVPNPPISCFHFVSRLYFLIVFSCFLFSVFDCQLSLVSRFSFLILFVVTSISSFLVCVNCFCLSRSNTQTSDDINVRILSTWLEDVVWQQVVW